MRSSASAPLAVLVLAALAALVRAPAAPVALTAVAVGPGVQDTSFRLALATPGERDGVRGATMAPDLRPAASGDTRAPGGLSPALPLLLAALTGLGLLGRRRA